MRKRIAAKESKAKKRMATKNPKKSKSFERKLFFFLKIFPFLDAYKHQEEILK